MLQRLSPKGLINDWKKFGHFERFLVVMFLIIWLELFIIGLTTIISGFFGDKPTLLGAICAIVMILYPIGYELAELVERRR